MAFRKLFVFVSALSVSLSLMVLPASAQEEGNVDFGAGNVQLGAPVQASAEASGGLVAGSLGADPPEVPASDTDGDGMPDAWETANGLDLNDPTAVSYTHLRAHET